MIRNVVIWNHFTASQSWLSFDIVTSNNAESSKWSPGSIVRLKGNKMTLFVRGTENLSIYFKNSS